MVEHLWGRFSPSRSLSRLAWSIFTTFRTRCTRIVRLVSDAKRPADWHHRQAVAECDLGFRRPGDDLLLGMAFSVIGLLRSAHDSAVELPRQWCSVRREGRVGTRPFTAPIVVLPLLGGSPFIVVGTQAGIYATNALKGSSTHWFRYGKGLPFAAVHDLYLHRAARMLLAATFGRGIWMAALNEIRAPAG